MPNWCWNTLTVEGEQVGDFARAQMGKTPGYFVEESLRKFYEVPEGQFELALF